MQVRKEETLARSETPRSPQQQASDANGILSLSLDHDNATQIFEALLPCPADHPNDESYLGPLMACELGASQ